MSSGEVTLVGGGPGAWDLLTIRSLRELEAADVILTDHLGPANQLEDFLDLSGKEIIDVAKLPYGKQVAQAKTNTLLVDHATAGTLADEMEAYSITTPVVYVIGEVDGLAHP